MTLPDDNMTFDRLVDGELSHAERQELLSSLDNRPDGWRRCALAFLEAQAWQGGFKSFVAPESTLPVVQTSFTGPQGATAPTSLPARPTSQGRWYESSMALAASALIAFGIGWNMNDPEIATRENQQLASIDSEVNRPIGDSRDAVTLVVKDDHGKHQRVRLPLMDAGEIGDHWAQFSPEVPVDLRAGLRDRGFDLQSKQRFAPLFFEQGEQLVPMVVPVNDTYVVPVNRPVY